MAFSTLLIGNNSDGPKVFIFDEGGELFAGLVEATDLGIVPDNVEIAGDMLHEVRVRVLKQVGVRRLHPKKCELH